METNTYQADARAKWQLVSLEDFLQLIEEKDSFEKWLKEQEFNKENSYLEVSVKIMPR